MRSLFSSALLVFACSISIGDGRKEIVANVTQSSEVLSREKRFLVFPPSTTLSVLKYIATYLGPIVSDDSLTFPSTSNVFALHSGHSEMAEH